MTPTTTTTAAARAVGPEEFRRSFPMLERTVHLAGCSLGARSQATEEALARMLEAMSALGAPWDRFEQEADAARRKFAALIGAQPEQIALVPNASVGAYQAISTMNLGSRDTILAPVEEFPSVSHVWHAQRRRGARVRLIGDGDGLRPDDLAAALDRRTALLSVPLSTYQYAERPPVPELVRAAAEAGARTFVDAYQAAGVLPVDVAELGCDYLVAGTSKYLLGLPGLAFLYARDGAASDHDPVLTGWFGRRDPFAFDPRRLDFPATARRFETGTPPVPALYAANAGFDLLAGLAPAEVERHVGALLQYAEELLAGRGERLRPSRPQAPRGAHLSLCDPDPHALGAWMAARGIAVSPRGPVVRIAVHYHTNRGDIEAFCDALDTYRAGAGPAAAATARPRAKPTPTRSPAADPVREVLAWIDDPRPTAFPFDAVIDEYHRVGKHFVGEELLKTLVLARERWAAEDGAEDPAQAADADTRDLLDAFLDTALDKFDNRYDYPTYTAQRVLGVLARPDADCGPEQAATAQAARDRQLVHLLADALAFELDAAAGRTGLLPEQRPDAGLVAKRHRLAVRVAVPALQRMGLCGRIAESDPADAARRLVAVVDSGLTDHDRRALRASMLPVYVSHDEYLFIRVLQSFETTFAAIALHIGAAIKSLDLADCDTVVGCLDTAAAGLLETAPLFSLLATMQVESFRTFRTYTEGASAIQSRNYKLVESLCRTPDGERLDSSAYQSTPPVRTWVLAGQYTLDDACRAALAGDRLTAADRLRLTGAMRRFAAALRRWRQTHYRLAVRMLGERSGTGYTEGTPYLDAVRTIPVFRSIDETAESEET